MCFFVLPSTYNLMNTPYKFIVTNTDSCWRARKGFMRIIIMKSMVSHALIMFSSSSRFVFGSMHFVANQLGDLSMQELEL
jgi:hypothetical protein